jgi:trehalose 6-phosphate phosphatase
VPEELAARIDGTPLVLMLDVDGTLAPIAARPSDAAVPPETRRVVAALAARDGVRVALVSGRAAADARRMVSASNVWVIGNHGFEMVSPDGEEEVEPELAAMRPAVAQASRRIAALVAPVPGVLLEDKGWTLSVHYRLADPAIVPRLVQSVEQVAIALGLRVTRGKMVLEVRPTARVDKGTAVLRLSAMLGGLNNGGAVVFIGDDNTDEDAFRALRLRSSQAITVRVTHGTDTPTAAEFTVEGPAAVRSFLEWVLERR